MTIRCVKGCQMCGKLSDVRKVVSCVESGQMCAKWSDVCKVVGYVKSGHNCVVFLAGLISFSKHRRIQT